jgi:hypothetical protein
MKKLILSFSLALLAFAGVATNASAQRYDPRVDVSRLAVDEARVYRGGHDERDWRGGEGRAIAELERLNAEVRQVRALIGDSRSVSQRIRDRYRRVKESTESLNYQFRRGNIRGWEVRRRAEEIRLDLERIRRELRTRHIGIGGWR